MVLIDNAGRTYVNESARDKLRTVWRGAYRNNMEKLIPMFATQLSSVDQEMNRRQQELLEE